MIGFWTEKENLGVLKSTAIVVAGALLFSIVAAPFAEASIWDERKKATEEMIEKKEKVQKAFQGIQKEEPTPARALSKELGIASGIEIPEELGTVVEAWGGKSALSPETPLVIHIQDAHGVYEAQKNASQILKILRSGDRSENSSGSPLLVCVEGAWGRVSPEWLSVFPDETLKKEMAERLLEDGEITGEEYLSILEGPGKLKIYGVEDKSIYEANVKAREIIDRERKAVLDDLEVLSSRLDKIKKRSYDRRLLELDWLSHQYENQKTDLKEFLTYLKKASPLSWDAGKYPQLHIFADLIRLEESFSHQGVESERKKLLEVLTERLDKQSLLQLGQVSLGYRLGKVTGESYYEGLIRLADAHQMSVTQMKVYLGYLSKYREIKSDLLSDEMNLLERDVYSRFSEGNDAIKKLVEMDRTLRIEIKFWDEKMAPADWEEYKGSSASGSKSVKSNKIVGWKEIEKYVRNEEKRLGVPEEVPTSSMASSRSKEKDSVSYIRSLKVQKTAKREPLTYAQMRYLQEGYYKLAFKRNEVLVQKTLEKAKEMGEERLVLIAGGFHTAGMIKLLRDRGIPYLVIRPRLSIPTVNKTEKKDRGNLPKGPDSEKYASFIKDYLKQLETLKFKTSEGKTEDTQLAKEVSRALDTIQNRLFFEGPVKLDGKMYLLGAYQGDEARVNFVMEFAKVTDSQNLASDDLRNALKQVGGTLRNMPGTSAEGLQNSLILVLGQTYVGLGYKLGGFYLVTKDWVEKFKSVLGELVVDSLWPNAVVREKPRPAPLSQPKSGSEIKKSAADNRNQDRKQNVSGPLAVTLAAGVAGVLVFLNGSNLRLPIHG
ncbi:MAG: hypothetical protein HYY63_04825, partial [Elusimicrobia bacterium]|nr:hypothetical protein [Elusimicrobiota bacterium]